MAIQRKATINYYHTWKHFEFMNMVIFQEDRIWIKLNKIINMHIETVVKC